MEPTLTAPPVSLGITPFLTFPTEPKIKESSGNSDKNIKEFQVGAYMKIYGNKPPENKGIYRTGKVDKKAGASAAGGGLPGVPDRVAFSARMKEIEALRPMVQQLPDIREHLVETLREEIENGSYNVDPRKVAEKIIEELI
jgi:flagellar biosynthesis anti-sigma factor FlgM